jgi:hypothetical protein
MHGILPNNLNPQRASYLRCFRYGSENLTRSLVHVAERSTQR